MLSEQVSKQVNKLGQRESYEYLVVFTESSSN